ncbi:hypothetical protein R1sor_019732 [Riccia sorocarpa]|uniref:Uncharacterized protein n=1 Tax=Riccia sorocarpa TaxID=122646 RepID=A0ABD3IGZ8_9MARC
MATPALQMHFSAQSMAASFSGCFMGLALSPARALPLATLRRPLTISVELKRWERKEVKPNSLPVRQNLHVKVGDTVQVISGADAPKLAMELFLLEKVKEITSYAVGLFWLVRRCGFLVVFGNPSVESRIAVSDLCSHSSPLQV